MEVDDGIAETRTSTSLLVASGIYAVVAWAILLAARSQSIEGFAVAIFLLVIGWLILVLMLAVGVGLLVGAVATLRRARMATEAPMTASVIGAGLMVVSWIAWFSLAARTLASWS